MAPDIHKSDQDAAMAASQAKLDAEVAALIARLGQDRRLAQALRMDRKAVTKYRDWQQD